MNDQEVLQLLADVESDRSERTRSLDKTDNFGEAICAFANDLPNHRSNFRSLLPLSLEARKPVFDLKAADGAIGSHAATTKDAHAAFEQLTRKIAVGAGIPARRARRRSVYRRP